MDSTRGIEKLVVTIAGSLVLLYCVAVLGFVATVPDLRLRVILSDPELPKATEGVVIRDVSGVVSRGDQPAAGDVLLRIGDKRIRSFLDFARSLNRLHRLRVSPEGMLSAGDDPSLVTLPLPGLVEVENGQRFVKVEFLHAGIARTSWLFVQSVPLDEILLTFIWFLLQLGIAAVGALAVWHRPFDRPARLFFGMCLVTMVAFVGGLHWWIVASTQWLNIPFMAGALLVPVVSLHFFLMYPRRTWPLTQFPRVATAALYAVPSLAFVSLVGMLASVHWLAGDEVSSSVEAIRSGLHQLRNGIYAYMTFASGCFLVMLAALARGYFRTTVAVERSQLKWMFWGGVSAVLPVGYTLYLALFDQVEFALGRARFAMFLASLSFMLAYAVAILRFKLMLIDQIVSKGMRYYAVSLGLTCAFAGLISWSTLTAGSWTNSGPVFSSWQQAITLAAVLIVAVMLLLWGRDRLQQMVDRRFYREKYQLDKALQRMNRAVERVGDRETLGHRMIGSCRDMLRVDRIGVYLRDIGSPTFQLIAAEGAIDLPSQIAFDDEFLKTLRQESAVSRSVTTLGGGITAGQQTMRMLRAALLYAFESDDELIGVVVLGQKQGGAPYTAEDLTFLNALGQITSVALHSVKVHQDVLRLNDELQLKAEKIDEQRRLISMLQTELKSTSTSEAASANQTPAEEFRRGAIKGSSFAIGHVLETVRKVATSESSVLITGASGTGKELLAQAIHDNSPRRGGPLVGVHCAALSPSLLESELFGHVKGAFTGAHKDRVGRFESAHGGTLFLDEIGDISLETQIKLLRVLQTRQFEPVGSTRSLQVDVRLIAATNQDLKKLIAGGKFREDLFYRLNVISIPVPTLAERRDDILELSLFFLKQASERLSKPITQLDDDVLQTLKRYSWPGNIRELENVIERAVVLAEGDMIHLRDLPREVLDSRHSGSKSAAPRLTAEAKLHPHSDRAPETFSVESLTHTLDRLDEFAEREALEKALRVASGNKAEAARMLGLPRSTFFSKLRKHRINKPR